MQSLLDLQRRRRIADRLGQLNERLVYAGCRKRSQPSTQQMIREAHDLTVFANAGGGEKSFCSAFEIDLDRFGIVPARDGRNEWRARSGNVLRSADLISRHVRRWS